MCVCYWCSEEINHVTNISFQFYIVEFLFLFFDAVEAPVLCSVGSEHLDERDYVPND